MTTVLLLAHPDFGASRAYRALLSGLTGLPSLEVTELYALYPDGRIDASVEREQLLRATRLVFQFPLRWYSTPALLKHWQDAVLTPLFYLEPKIAALMAGLPLFTAPASYGTCGTAMTIDEPFAPLRATARKCEWRWQTPLAVHECAQPGRRLAKTCGRGLPVRAPVDSLARAAIHERRVSFEAAFHEMVGLMVRPYAIAIGRDVLNERSKHMRLVYQTLLVVGGTSGIGLTTAHAAAGARVIIAGRNREKLALAIAAARRTVNWSTRPIATHLMPCSRVPGGPTT